MQRYSVSATAGQRGGNRYAVIDRRNRQRVSWHATFKAAQARAKRLNAKEEGR